MAEQDEHDPREGATPAGESPAARPGPSAAPANGGETPAAPAGGGQAPPPPDRPVAPAPPGPGAPPPQGGAQTDFLESGRTAPPYVEGAAPPPGPGRWRRWSSNGSVRAGALTLVAGLVGGLVGGGIVAAFDDDHGHDRSVQVRFGPGGIMGRGYGHAPRDWAPPNGWGPNRRVPQPGQPATPAPVPSPKSSG
ncbi:hypothetical protein OG417_37410 [Actinoallomurus sp. NBC_01490]|uniref:hypothetical protein n=1 Tax=Actinoallomurus sp. NBC_01490 TaxID=2903557 RepID=UPI002E33BBDC|nr:hypothetical protein [Actinoallomurus sp. NBC_01490]